MRRHLPVASCFIFLFFVACGGGGGDDPPPPPATSPAGAETIDDMKVHIGRAKKDCLEGFAPAILSAFAAKRSGQSASVLPLLLGANSDGCDNALKNILAEATRVDNGAWIQRPESKIWLMMQVASIINKIGEKLQAQGVPNPEQVLQELRPQIQQMVEAKIIPSLSGVNPQVGNEIRSRY